jgi:hypothetical protein
MTREAQSLLLIQFNGACMIFFGGSRVLVRGVQRRRDNS